MRSGAALSRLLPCCLSNRETCSPGKSSIFLYHEPRAIADVRSREHPASEVYVTGTFDDWSKSEKLVKTGDVFEKDVTLSSKSAEEKIYYKVRRDVVGLRSVLESRRVWGLNLSHGCCARSIADSDTFTCENYQVVMTVSGAILCLK